MTYGASSIDGCQIHISLKGRGSAQLEGRVDLIMMGADLSGEYPKYSTYHSLGPKRDIRSM